MIKECNFKYKFIKGNRKGKEMCELSISSLTSCFVWTEGFIHKREHTRCDDMIYPKECSGEENCILFQIYKSKTVDISDDEFTRILCDRHGHMAVRKEDYNGKCPHCERDVVRWG